MKGLFPVSVTDKAMKTTLDTIDVAVQKSRPSLPLFTLPKGSVKPKHKNP
jgi:hypothetical protein